MKFARPINTGGNPANISTPFGPNHPGIDYAYPEGTKVYASEDGEIVIAKSTESRQWIANSPSDPYLIPGKTRALRTEDYGNFVKIQHSGGYASLYAHLKKDSLVVKEGSQVKKGQLIAQVGSTGNSTGNHTHWETRLNEAAFDPNSMFDNSFKDYSDKTPAAQVAVDADVFPKLVHNSTEWEKTATKYVPGKDPKDTQFEEVDRVVAGYKSRSTDLEKQVTYERTEKENREEQVGRLKDQVLNEEKLRAELNNKLNEALTEPTKLVGVYEAQLTKKQEVITAQSKRLGDLNHEVAELEIQVKNLKAGVVPAPTLYEAIQTIIGKVLPFLKTTKM
jgi:hypothetical protein